MERSPSLARGTSPSKLPGEGQDIMQREHCLFIFPRKQKTLCTHTCHSVWQRLRRGGDMFLYQEGV